MVRRSDPAMRWADMVEIQKLAPQYLGEKPDWAEHASADIVVLGWGPFAERTYHNFRWESHDDERQRDSEDAVGTEALHRDAGRLAEGGA